MFAFAPVRCCPCSCVDGQGNITINITEGGGTGTGCSLQGAVDPNGVEEAPNGCQYRQNDGVNWTMWYKEYGDGDAFGWIPIQIIPLTV